MKYGIFSLLVFFFGPRIASAHVGYVISSNNFNNHIGSDFSFFFSPLSDPNSMLIIASAIIIFLSLYYFWHHNAGTLKELAHIKKRLLSYQDLVPWMLRLGLGILTVGASIHHVVLSPFIADTIGIGGILLFLGFCILSGFLLTPAILAIIVVFCLALSQNLYVFGSLEILGSAVALLLFSDSRPGFDDIVGIPKLSFDKYKRWISSVLRYGIGGSFIFLALFEKIFNPHLMAEVIVRYNLQQIVPVSVPMWVFSIGMIELILGLCIFFGYHTRLSAAIAFVVISLTFFYFKEAVYSHVTLFAGLSALFVLGGGYGSIDERTTPKKIARRVKPKTRKNLF